MRTGLFHTLLLIALLALAGQSLAAPCGAHANSAPAAAAQMSASDHCAPLHNHGQAGHCHSGGNGGDLGCHCCPGHCIGAVPADEAVVATPPRPGATTTYIPFKSSPEPDTALRPPIRA